LGNPLDDSLPELTRLVDRLARKARTPTNAEQTETGPAKVELIRSAIGATSVAYVGRADSAHGGAANFVAIDATDGFRLDDFQPVLWAADSEGSPSPDRRAFGYTVREGEQALWCVPLGRHNQQSQFLIVVDPPAWLEKLGQMAAKVLQTIWGTGFAVSPAEAEVHVLTALRGAFGRLPEKLFRRSRDLYCEVLNGLRIVFQPIVTIGESPKQVGIHSYEALARRSVAEQSAPVPLLELAHTWGDHFVVERDKIILGKALTAYALAHGRSTWNQEIPKPVSVNVSVRSLLDDSYIDTLRQLITQLELPPHVITLEISERDAIEPWNGEHWEGAHHSFFNKRLVQVAQDLEVSFALDDFGTGHASLDRMSGLTITHIKIDRAILFHRQAIEELELVVSIARDAFDRGEAHAARPVIVEGVEHDCPVSLNEIYASGIRHIQGYITGQRGAPDLRHLSLEVRKDIAARVRHHLGDVEAAPPGVGRGDPPVAPEPIRAADDAHGER
jgi:EAL domain-containing protein (putative c-di-GMP-specific phosphodiesterase class I)